ncbi:amidohydrolase family-domain-containing protein [Fusarium oxysporum Fo47]|uniref:amidohydrolase family-domain-containing protein n=1 Tax=Fusarium oxysporum Fo47 TaxID=660027 RepID=UPI002869BC8B|nr:amidohydrolase family-domain-containing protein [Fusarium oxysporum Fo47]QKD57876.2 amidohydrolase family-domain-containing protein [Fusarium oxysporum Fo47]
MSDKDLLNAAHNSVAYINGRVYTVNKTLPWAEAFIVDSNGIFSAVGNTREIVAAAKAASMVVYNLKGRFVMPGIHDAHVHTIVSGSGLLNWAQTGYDVTRDNVVEHWIFGGAGFGFENFDRSLLDKDYPDTPVVLLGVGCHDWYTNTAALRRAGYDVEQGEVDPIGGKHELRPDGSLTGELKDQAGNRLMAALPKPAKAHIKRVVKRAIVEMHRHGVTSCQDASSTEMFLTALSELEAEGNLKMQFATHCLYKNEWLTGEIQVPADKLILNADKYQSRHVDTRFVKMMMDGACAPSLMSHSDVDDNGMPDQSKILLPNAAELVQRFDARGMTCKIHCMGYGGARTALDAFKSVREKQPGGPRHEVAHCTRVLPEDYKRFKRLNITAEMSPSGFFDTSQSENMRLFQYDFERMLAEEAHITIGSDWAHGLELPMFRNTAILVKKIGAEKVLEMITLAGAVATRREKEAGSIEAGKVASFICVDRDLTHGDFQNAKVLKTWFEGEVVYDAANELV